MVDIECRDTYLLSVYGELKQFSGFSALMAAISSAGVTKLVLKFDSDDDTRWEKGNSTIFLSRLYRPERSKANLISALIFELCNAANPHKYTDEVESILCKLSQKDDNSLKMIDFIVCAEAMERDEWFSLQKYRSFIESNLSMCQEHEWVDIWRSKYVDLVDDESFSGELSYEHFKQQNLQSGHTLMLAKLQYENYYQQDDAYVPILYRVSTPPKRARSKQAYAETLLKEKTAGVYDIHKALQSWQKVYQLTPVAKPLLLGHESNQKLSGRRLRSYRGMP